MSKLKFFISTSTNFGFSPAWTIGQSEVDQHKAGIRHSSLGKVYF